MMCRGTATFGLLLIIVSGAFLQEAPHKDLTLDCSECHQTKEWSQVRFDHTQTGFALADQHAEQACSVCHQIEDFAQVSKECSGCHLDVHQGKLTYTCGSCHSTRSWNVFDIYKVHRNSAFPILGAHGRLDCLACHKSETVGEYARLQSDCLDCHRSDFQSAQNPVHSDIGFGSRCEDCHAMLAWVPATFRDHDSRFPISSGSHAGEWDSCMDCHLIKGDYSVYSCLHCHEHNQAKMVSEHDEVAGFVYDSEACYGCHPRGVAEEE